MRPLCGSIAVATGLALLQGCGRTSEDTGPVAYIAPATVNLRRELVQKNSTVAVLKHGDRVRMLEIRRRFIKVRAPGNTQGWLDVSALLTKEQMAQVNEAAKTALALPSEGTAGVYEALNVHIDPARQSPAFTQIPEGSSVQVLAQKLVPKLTGPVRVSTTEFQKALAPPPIARKQKTARKPQTQLPPNPAPPKPPEDWLAMSGDDAGIGKDEDIPPSSKESKSSNGAKAPAETKPGVLESWTLVRTKDSQSGWVLSRNLVMSIPDEVAQYAEGRRITSYFDLGEVPDEEKGPKHNWLWTTAFDQEAYDFDSWRVFLWNRRRHRYETSYRQRDVEGYFPVHVDNDNVGSHDRRFQLILKNDAGQLVRNNYSFDGVRVHLTASEPYNPNAAPAPSTTAPSPIQPQGTNSWTWLQNQLDKIRKEFRKRA